MSPWFAGITPIFMGIYLIFFHYRESVSRSGNGDHVPVSPGKKKIFLFIGLGLIAVGIARLVMPFFFAH